MDKAIRATDNVADVESLFARWATRSMPSAPAKSDVDAFLGRRAPRWKDRPKPARSTRPDRAGA